MKKSKILLTVILCLAMVLTMFNGVVFATETTEDVTPVVNYGAASIEGDTIHLMENAPTVIAFTSAQNWDIFGYQYSEARPEGLDIQDETPLEGDSLVPTYRFGNLTAGTYEFTLTISENENYETVYQKTYTLDVKAVDQGPTYGDAKDYVSGKLTDVKNFYANGNNVTIVEENGKTIGQGGGLPGHRTV